MRCCTAMLATAVCWGLSDGVLAIGGQAEQANPFDAPILPVRPRVFIRADETFEGLTIAKLRQARQQPDLAQFVRKWPSKPLGRALLWLTDGKPEDLAAAIAGLKRMEAAGQSWSDRGLALMELSALLDWLWAELDEPTRRQVVAKIEKAADEAVQHIRGGQAPFFYSRTPGALAGLCLAAIALKGESQKADGYLEVFRQYGPGEYFKAYQWVDGAATGATYTIYYTYVDLPAIAAAWWSATGKNPNAWIRKHQGDWLDGIVRFYLWYMRPGFAFTDINDQYRDQWASHDQFCRGLDIACYVTRNRHGRAWAERWAGRFGPELYHAEYAPWAIFRDGELRAESLEGLPRAELFGRESCGYGFFRSAWPAPGEPDTATHVFFRCGDPMDVHGGVAAGEFQVFKYAPLAARSGRYSSYDSPPDQYHRNCISANVVLFLDPANADDRGDQNTRRGLKTDHATWAQWLAIREKNKLDVAEITEWQVSPGLARCRADLTRTNPPTKCKQWIRELVWLADKHLIVLDVVETAQTQIRRLWQLHSQTPPEIGHDCITIVNQIPDLRWADDRLRPRPGRARLFCQTLEPRKYTVVVHSGGKAVAYDDTGRSLGACAGNPYHLKYGNHVLQIDPGNDTARTVFLHVLTAVDATVTSAPKCQLRVLQRGQVEVSVEGAKATLSVPEWFSAADQ